MQTKRTDDGAKARDRLHLLLLGALVVRPDAHVVAIGQDQLLEVEALIGEAGGLVPGGSERSGGGWGVRIGGARRGEAA
jgi:hypothetical protein